MAERVSYDELWRTTWGEIQQVGPVHRHVHENLVRLVARLGVRSMLDVGCGSGDTLALLASSGTYELCGTDVSERALALARQRVPAARLHLLDVEREVLPETFDLVLSIGVVEHLADDTEAFRNMARMSREYVFVSTIAGRMRRSEAAIGHLRNYRPSKLREKLELAGLDVLRLRRWGFPFYSPLYRTVSEWLPGGPPTGELGRLQRLVAKGLYQLYRLNVPGRGDIISALARRRSPETEDAHEEGAEDRLDSDREERQAE